MNINLAGGLLGVFVLGLLAGFAGDKAFSCHRYPPPPMPFGPMDCHRGGFDRDQERKGPALREKHNPEGFILKQLQEELSLNEEQAKKSEQIFKDTHSKIKEAGNSFHQQIKKFIDEGWSELKKDLTPEQQKKLEELQKRMEEKNFFHRGASSPSFPPGEERREPVPSGNEDSKPENQELPPPGEA